MGPGTGSVLSMRYSNLFATLMFAVALSLSSVARAALHFDADTIDDGLSFIIVSGKF